MIRIESCHLLFHWYMNGMIEAIFCMMGYNGRLGYSVYSPNKTTKVNYQFLNDTLWNKNKRFDKNVGY